jgi:hypothetical protein
MANSTDTLFGAENVRSTAATVELFVIGRSTLPPAGWHPRINAMKPSRSTRDPAARPRASTPAPSHTPGASPRPA